MEAGDCGMPRMEQLKEKEDEEVSAYAVLAVGDLIKMFTKNKIKTGSEMFVLIWCFLFFFIYLLAPLRSLFIMRYTFVFFKSSEGIAVVILYCKWIN